MCDVLGGDLVEIQDGEENDYITAQASLQKSKYFSTCFHFYFIIIPPQKSVCVGGGVLRSLLSVCLLHNNIIYRVSNWTVRVDTDQYESIRDESRAFPLSIKFHLFLLCFYIVVHQMY